MHSYAAAFRPTDPTFSLPARNTDNTIVKVIYGCDLGTLHEKLELGNLPAKEMKKVMHTSFVCMHGFHDPWLHAV